MESSRKQKTFSQFLSTFLKPNLNFEDFQKSDDSHSSFISEVTASEERGYING